MKVSLPMNNHNSWIVQGGLLVVGGALASLGGAILTTFGRKLESYQTNYPILNTGKNYIGRRLNYMGILARAGGAGVVTAGSFLTIFPVAKELGASLHVAGPLSIVTSAFIGIFWGRATDI